MVWQPRGEDRTTCLRELQEKWNFTPNSNSICAFDHYVTLKCVVQVWVPSHLSPSRKRRESLPRRASSLWASSHALQQVGAKLKSEIMRDDSACVRGYTRTLTSSLCLAILPMLRLYLKAFDWVSYNIFILLLLCSCYSCFTSPCRIVMPYRTFFCYANSTQEADEWIKILQWKLVSVPWVQLSHIIKTLLNDSILRSSQHAIMSNCFCVFWGVWTYLNPLNHL